MVPEYDWDLHRDLIAMRERYGNHRHFYMCAPWRRLRRKVLEQFHYESQDELKASPAKYVRAECVHHDRFVDLFPGWALSEFWVDDDGVVRRNLIPLSHDAHDARHERMRHQSSQARREASNPLTVERW